MLVRRLEPGLAFPLSLLLVACGPGGDSGSGSEETGAGSSESTDTGEAQEQLGIVAGPASHSYQCIDGCEGFYSDDWFSVDLLADAEGPALDVELAWHDWTTQASGGLSEFDPPFGVEMVHLEPGELTTVSFHVSRDGFCDNESEWSEPMRALITIDGVPVEVEGNTSGAGGWDC